MAEKKVLVVGGGVGGLSTAIALRKSGVEVDVFEINESWKVYHVGIIVQGNFIRAMDHLGVGKEAVKSGFSYGGVQFRDCLTDEVTGELAAQNIAGEGFPSELGITRPALHEVLSKGALDAGANVRLGVTWEKITEKEDCVEVLSTEGDVQKYDFIVGADGAYSPLRKHLFGDKYTNRFTGQGVWRYNLPRPEWLTHGIVYSTSEDGRKPGFIPLSEDTMYLFLVTSEPGNPFHDPSKMDELLRERMKGFGGLLEEITPLITDPEKVVYRPMEVCVLNEPWHKGRVLLIGDAAHAATPHFGQGGGAAVEDAEVLGQLVAQGLEGETLFDTFMERRYERAKFIAEGSIQIGEWEMHGSENADPMGLMGKMRELIAEPV